jgi:hypothetical protein
MVRNRKMGAESTSGLVIDTVRRRGSNFSDS